MDFHSLSRRDLQSLCKKNKIPANMTNVAMADALKALEIVEGLEEFLNQTESGVPPSPSSVAKELPTTARTAGRTTRRTATKDATQSSQSVARSSRVTKKSLAGEMDQENKNMNVLQSPAVPASRRKAATSVAQESEIKSEETENDVKLEANVPNTPAARSTRRKAPLPASSRSQAPVTNNNGSVQQAYSTRRSVRLLERCMADLSLKPKEDMVESVEDGETEKEKAAQEMDPAGLEFLGKADGSSERTEETEVIAGRDLSATLDKEWDTSDESLEDETHNEKNEFDVSKGGDSEEIQAEKTESEVIQASDSSLQVEDKELSHARAESKIIQAFDSSLQAEDKESPQAKALSPIQKMMIQDNVSGHPASATSPVACKEIQDSVFEEGLAEGDDDKNAMDQEVDEVLKVDSPVSGDANMSINAEKDSAKPEELDDSDSESDWSREASDSDIEDDQEEDDTGVDSNQAMGFECEGDSVAKSLTTDGDRLEKPEADSSEECSESDQSEAETERDSEEDPEEDEISDADSNTAVFGSDVAACDADEESDVVESEVYENLKDNKTEETVVTASDKKTPTSPLPTSAGESVTLMSPFAAESISGQFPRPTLSTTPAKSSSKKKQSSALKKLSILADYENENKDNVESHIEGKAEMPKKKKKNAVDEESLKGVSLRQLTKMVKELAIKNNRTALQTLPDNQIAEHN